jgi:hypothetical protein
VGIGFHTLIAKGIYKTLADFLFLIKNPPGGTHLVLTSLTSSTEADLVKNLVEKF